MEISNYDTRENLLEALLIHILFSTEINFARCTQKENTSVSEFLLSKLHDWNKHVAFSMLHYFL